MVEPIKIDFAIIGAQKAATTTLYDLLKQHPEIAFPPMKEDNYFAFDDTYRLGHKHLAMQYAKALSSQKIGHAYVNIMYYASICAPRMWEHNPRMKLIALLRNPIDRAYSAFWYARNRGWEMSDSFEDAIRREEEGGISDNFTHQGILTYLKHGHYAEQLKVFIDTFGRDAVRVHFQNELQADAVGLCKSLFDYIGVTSDFRVDGALKSNVASRPMIAALPRFINNPSSLKKIYQAITPYKMRRLINRNFLQKIEKLNQATHRYPPMSERTRHRLEDYYAPHNDKLRALIGRAF